MTGSHLRLTQFSRAPATLTRTIGITLGTLLLVSGPALAVPAASAIISWRTADAVAAERVPGRILATRLNGDEARPVYDVAIHTPGNRLEEVRVDARTATVLGVHQMTEPGIIGEIEAP